MGSVTAFFRRMTNPTESIAEPNLLLRRLGPRPTITTRNYAAPTTLDEAALFLLTKVHSEVMRFFSASPVRASCFLVKPRRNAIAQYSGSMHSTTEERTYRDSTIMCGEPKLETYILAAP